MLTELMELLVPVLEALATEAESLGLEINGRKQFCRLYATFRMTPFHHSVGARGLHSGGLPGCSHPFVNSQLSRHPETECIHVYTTAMQSLDKQLWCSRISLSTKLRPYNTCILPIFLYGSLRVLDDYQGRRTQDQCPPSMVSPYASRHQVVSLISNDEVRRQTNQPLLTEVIQAWRLTLFGHIARMDDNVDAKQILTSSPSVYWKRPSGRLRMTWTTMVQNDLDSHGLSWTDTINLAQNRPLWRLLTTSGAAHL